MKIDPNDFDLTPFLVKEGVFCGLSAVLVTPNHIGTKFTQANKIFRSSIWKVDNLGFWELLSASYKKFVNWGENPENFPVPTSLDGTTIVDKIDGSACVIDYVNGILSMRTRGTFSTDTMENATDFKHCLDKYPKMVKWIKDNPNYSLITEITTPNLRIVIRYGDEPDFWLTGAINKNDYSLMKQTDLDNLAKELGMVRPSAYTFSSISDLLENVEKWEGKEGICLYCNEDQEIFKIKASSYLIKHRLKEEFGSLEKVLDFFVSEGCPDYSTFYGKVAEVVDFETAEECRGDISKCVDAWKEVEKILDHMVKFCSHLQDKFLYPTRKEQALKVLSSYSTTNRSAMVFKLLDGKMLTKEDHAKLMWQVLKKS